MVNVVVIYGFYSLRVVVLPSVGNSITGVIQPCIWGLNTDSLYSNTVYFLGIHTVTNTVQYGLTAVLPPRIKVGLLTLLSLPCCRYLAVTFYLALELEL